MTQPQLLIALLLMQQGLCAFMWVMAAYLRISRRAAAHWAVSTAVVAVAMALLLMRGTLSPWWSLMLANLLIMAGVLLLRRGVQRFCRSPVTDRESAVLIVGYAAVLALIVSDDADPARVAVIGSIVVAWVFVRLGMDIQSGLASETGTRVARWCASPAFLAAGVFLARGLFVAVRGGEAHGSLAAQSTVNLVTTMVMMVFGLVVNAQMVALTVVRLVTRLKRQTERDPLTDLYNRRAMERLIDQESQRQRRMSTDFALLSVDIDHFKRINDRYGHGVGDEVLRHVALTLREGCRSIDRVARMGGEEFWILLPGATRDDALLVGDRLLQAVRAMAFGDVATGLQVTISIGQASARTLDEPMDLLLRRLDLALYAAKDGGRDRLVPAAPPH